MLTVTLIKEHAMRRRSDKPQDTKTPVITRRVMPATVWGIQPVAATTQSTDQPVTEDHDRIALLADAFRS